MTNEIAIISEESIKDKIYTIRGEKVMLDFDLARIYGYSTKAFNQQVKNNKEKFEGFAFRLTKDETNTLMGSRNLTSQIWIKGNTGGRTYLPYAFTESGIYMLMTVLRGPLATEQSRKLITIFKGMKDYLYETKQLTTIDNVISLVSKINNQEKRITYVEDKLDVLMDNFIDPSKYKEFLIMNGNKFEADVAYNKIYRKAKNSIVIIDDYIDIKTLELLKGISEDIEVSIFSDNVNKLSQMVIDDFIIETNIQISLNKTHHLYHDRFILIDNESLFVSGPSSKDAGNSIGVIIEIYNKEIIETIKRII